MYARVSSRLVNVTPVLDTNAYASGDRLGAIQEIPKALPGNGFLSTLASLTIIDAADQKAAIDLLFFSALPTVASADNAAIDITDAEMKAKCIGMVSVAASDWTTIKAGGGGNAVASLKNVGLVLKTVNNTSVFPLLTSVYVVAVIRGSATYGVSDLVFEYGIYQD